MDKSAIRIPESAIGSPQSAIGSPQSAIRIPQCHDAIILAAGMGIRLRSMVRDRPKGLIEIDHETLVGRSVRLLRHAGMTRITIVTGYAAGQYEQFARDQSDIQLVVNDHFATTGSMASLAVGLARAAHDSERAGRRLDAHVRTDRGRRRGLGGRARRAAARDEQECA